MGPTHKKGWFPSSSQTSFLVPFSISVSACLVVAKIIVLTFSDKFSTKWTTFKTISRFDLFYTAVVYGGRRARATVIVNGDSILTLQTATATVSGGWSFEPTAILSGVSYEPTSRIVSSSCNRDRALKPYIGSTVCLHLCVCCIGTMMIATKLFRVDPVNSSAE